MGIPTPTADLSLPHATSVLDKHPVLARTRLDSTRQQLTPNSHTLGILAAAADQ